MSEFPKVGNYQYSVLSIQSIQSSVLRILENKLSAAHHMWVFLWDVEKTFMCKDGKSNYNLKCVFFHERNIVVFIPSIFWLCYSLHRKQRLTFKHWKSGWEDKTLQKWLQFGLSSAGKMCTDLVFYARTRDRKENISFTALIVWGRRESGWAPPVMVSILNYVLMKMDMKESRLHRVRKKKQDKPVSPRGQQTGTQRVFAGAQRRQFPQQRWTEKPLEQWAEAGTVEIPQVVMSPS